MLKTRLGHLQDKETMFPIINFMHAPSWNKMVEDQEIDERELGFRNL